jgi:hypothetical protein
VGFGVFYGRLVYFEVVRYIVSQFCMLYQEKSETLHTTLPRFGCCGTMRPLKPSRNGGVVYIQYVCNGIDSACQRGDWSNRPWDRIPSRYRVAAFRTKIVRTKAKPEHDTPPLWMFCNFWLMEKNRQNFVEAAKQKIKLLCRTFVCGQLNSAAGRVTRWVCEKITQNVAQPILL